jgi:flagellar basal body-associated protein FliL
VAKTIPTDRARQAKQGRPVLIVLIVALLLAMIVWAAVEIWGMQIADNAVTAPGGVTDQANPEQPSADLPDNPQ